MDKKLNGTAKFLHTVYTLKGGEQNYKKEIATNNYRMGFSHCMLICTAMHLIPLAFDIAYLYKTKNNSPK